MRKLVTGVGGLVFISLVLIAVHLWVSRAVADAKNGLSPFTALPLRDGRNTGILASGESRWYEFTRGGNGDAFQQRADLTLFFTPDDGNRVYRVHFQIFPADQITRWYQGDASQMRNLGAGGVVSRDGNPVTGELLWSGWVAAGETYYIQVLNGSDAPIDYYLFTGDIIGAELGPSAEPSPAPDVSAEINPDRSLTPPPTVDISVETSAEPLLPLASELQSDHLAVTAKTGYIQSGVPTRLVIPAIALDSEVIPVGWQPAVIDGITYSQWNAANALVGWHNRSAKLGQVGNTVLNGHSDVNTEIFRNLKYVEIGDEITVFSGERDYRYTVTEKFLVEEKEVPLEERLGNAKWIAGTPDERLTLVTCANPGATHRLIVIARPAPHGR